MDIERFALERWFACYEHEADIFLANSGIRTLKSDRFDLDPGSLGYVIPTNGDPELRAKIGERYDRSAEEVLLTNGTQEANFVTFLSLLSDDKHAVVISPVYQSLVSVPEAIGSISKVWLEPPDWELSVEAVANAIQPETSMIVLNNPNNPTGRYHSWDKIKRIYELAARNNCYLVCDEVFRHLAEDPQPPVASLGEYGVSTAGLTKAYGLPGLRFGWIAGPAEVIDAAWEWKDYTTISPSIFGQHVARQALGEQEDDILSENRTLARQNRDRLGSFINEHDLEWYEPSVVNALVRTPPAFETGTEFCRTLVEEQSVVLAPGELFGYPKYFRIGCGLEKSEFKEGLSRVSEHIRKHQ